MAEILKFAPKITSNEDLASGGDESLYSDPTVSVNHSGEESTQKNHIPTEDLYPLRSEMNPELASIFILLKEGIQIISNAVEAIEENDPIASDDAIQRFQALLPELFCCRNLGDGFGAVINSLFHALTNLNGKPLNLKQIQILKQVVCRLYSEPFIEFDEAVAEIIVLENVGFVVEPSYYKFAGELLDE